MPTPTTTLVAYASFTGLVNSQEKLQDAVDSTNNGVPKYDSGDNHQQQMAVLQIQHLEEEMAAARAATRAQVVAAEGAARKEDAIVRVVANVARNSPIKNHSSYKIGDKVERATPINTSIPSCVADGWVA